MFFLLSSSLHFQFSHFSSVLNSFSYLAAYLLVFFSANHSSYYIITYRIISPTPANHIQSCCKRLVACRLPCHDAFRLGGYLYYKCIRGCSGCLRLTRAQRTVTMYSKPLYGLQGEAQNHCRVNCESFRTVSQ